MCMKKSVYLVVTAIFFVSGIRVSAQTTTPMTFGLEKPAAIITAGQSSLLVAEAGTFAPNQGRISIVDRTSGVRRSLITGLPSALSLSGGESAPSGPSGLILRGRKLYLTIGQGNAVVPNRRGGEIPNPGVSSPLFNSVLELTLPADYEELAAEFALGLSDQTTIANNGQVMLLNAEGKTLTIRLVANLPDYKSERNPRVPQNNVRPSNLFGVEVAGDNLYVVDASFNLIYRVDINTGQESVLTVFPPRPNPLPFGPPFYEAVPDSIRLVGDRLLVSFLTGFPFPQGNAEIRSVDLQTGSHQPMIGGLTAAIDVLPVPLPGDHDLYFTLEFSANMLGNPAPPGRLKLFTSPTAEPVILAANLITPTSFARDPATGDVFVTEIFPGRIIRVSGSETAAAAEKK